MVLIKIVAIGSRVLDQWLWSYDPEAFDGRGDIRTTSNISLAMKFDSIDQALDLYRSVPACRPLRDDGKPNRPLTAATVEFIADNKVR
jgi:hypothetical protein